MSHNSEARSTLKKWREEHARRSEEIVEIWDHVLSRYSGSLKDELWPVLEQVISFYVNSVCLHIKWLVEIKWRFLACGKQTQNSFAIFIKILSIF